MAITPIWITGFEYGLAAPVTTGGGLFNGVTGTPAIQGTIKRSGSYALETDTTGGAAACYVQKTITDSPTVIVARMYFRVDTEPNDVAHLLSLYNSGGSSINFAWNPADHKVYLRWGSTNSQSSSALSTGTWYRLECRANISANPWTVDWQIDGSALTQGTLALAAASFNSCLIANAYPRTFKAYFDDIILSITSGDYPIGEGSVIGLRPNADGTHNNASNIMEDIDGNDIDGSTYFAYDKLDENPWITTANADLVRQRANGTDKYCEVLFTNTAETVIQGAMAVLQYASETANANNGATIIIDEDATATTLYGSPASPADMSETSAFYKSVILPTPTGGWDTAAVNALKARIGYSGDANPDPYWLALILEVACGVGVSDTELVIAEASHAHSSDAIALTQVHNLAVADTGHTQTVDEPILTENKTLAVSPSDHGQTADAPILTQVHTLAVADGSHAHEADAPVLTQSHVLAVVETAHTNEVDSPVLTQVHTLTVQEGAHVHSVDPVNLTQVHTLAVAEADHTHTAEEPTLDVSSILEIQEASHAHAVDSPALTQIHFLAVNDSGHIHVSDGITFTQLHQLLVNAAEHGHTVDPILLTQAHLLAVSDGGHAHTTDGIVLETIAPHFDLAVQDAAHSHVSDVILLSQIHLLNVDDISHLFISDGIDLTQLHLLLANDAIHTHSCDEPLLDTMKPSVDSKYWASKKRGPQKITKYGHKYPGGKRMVSTHFGD